MIIAVVIVVVNIVVYFSFAFSFFWLFLLFEKVQTWQDDWNGLRPLTLELLRKTDFFFLSIKTQKGDLLIFTARGSKAIYFIGLWVSIRKFAPKKIAVMSPSLKLKLNKKKYSKRTKKGRDVTSLQLMAKNRRRLRRLPFHISLAAAFKFGQERKKKQKF